MGVKQQQGQNRHLQGNRDEHQAEIGRCGIRQGPLDINLGNGHQRSTDRTDRADHLQHHEGDGRMLQQRHHLQQHNCSAGDHHRVAQN